MFSLSSSSSSNSTSPRLLILPPLLIPLENPFVPLRRRSSQRLIFFPTSKILPFLLCLSRILVVFPSTLPRDQCALRHASRPRPLVERTERKRRRRAQEMVSAAAEAMSSPPPGFVKLKRELLEARMTCPLCHKILREATTLSECLHSCMPCAPLPCFSDLGLSLFPEFFFSFLELVVPCFYGFQDVGMSWLRFVGLGFFYRRILLSGFSFLFFGFIGFRASFFRSELDKKNICLIIYHSMSPLHEALHLHA